MNSKDDIQKLIEEASKGATVIVSTPDTVKKMQAQGVPIEEKFTTYEEYFEKLVDEKRKTAVALLKQLPLLDKTVGNGVIANYCG